MLSAADEKLILRNPGFAELSLVLHDQRLSRALEQLLGKPGLSVRARSVRFKPGVSCMVSGEINAFDNSAAFYAVSFASSPSKVEAAIARGAIRVGEHSIAFLFPADAELCGLATLFNSQSRPELLSRVLGDTLLVDDLSLTPVAYKPERRCVFRVDRNGQPVAVLKLHHESRYEHARRNSKLKISGTRFVVPSRLGRAGSAQLIAFNWLQGTLWQDTFLDATVSPRHSHNVGAALAEFHQSSICNMRPSDPRPEHTIADFAAGVVALTGSASPALDRLVVALNHAEKHLTGPHTLCHGDFYAKQVLLMRNDQIGFIDLDDAHLGPAEEDIGNCIAHLHRMELGGRLAQSERAAIEGAFLAGYRSLGSQISAPLLAYNAARALFRLCMQPFRDREHNWPTGIGLLVERAHQLMGNVEC